jgi:hypothetical protein
MAHKPFTPLMMYFGHHKCATSWVMSILRPVCREMNWKYGNFHNPRMFAGNLHDYLVQNQYQFVSYINADAQHVSGVQLPFKGFHIIRDPRDIIVSSYFSSLNSHPTNQWPELITHREKIKTHPLDAGLLLEMDFIHDVMEHLTAWNYNQPNVLELRFEEVTRDPYQSFLSIFEFLGCLDNSVFSHKNRITYTLAALARRAFKFLPSGSKVPADVLLGRVYQNRFSKKSAGRAQGSENTKSHYRKGISGDWANYFTREHRAAFKQKYGNLVVRLGYESHNDW